MGEEERARTGREGETDRLTDRQTDGRTEIDRYTDRGVETILR